MLPMRTASHDCRDQHDFWTRWQEIELGENEGYASKRNLYKFFATSSEPLVMIRVGNPAHKHMGHPNRVNAQGNEMRVTPKKQESRGHF